ncbi:MFS transporter [Streptomyces hoynatensis]|uniref:MFS transporter n=1 Tax=Streptomyces hoynatensis TaxID=1141874 RepID=A0A3A9Z5B5_9ACTN|nr:MFS transporter [Streptomyces hoynatensis]RKN43209.1 MFS transporter [Streptomyces hoynatensis]
MRSSERRHRLLLPVVLAGMFMYGFDLNVINVAVPSLQHDLHAGQAALELVVGGYAFAYAAGLVTGGRLGDLYGHRRMFLLGMAAFTAASVLCGLAQSPGQLVAARLLQGLTAAMMVPQILAVIMGNFAAEERPKALAWFGVTAAVSGVFGQVLGGLLLDADAFGLGWRVIFLLNLPVGVVVLALAAGVLPRGTAGRQAALDPVGVLGVSGSLALALVPLVLGRGQGWPPWCWGLLIASVPVALLTLSYERRLLARGSAPLLDLSLFRVRTFSAGLAVSVAFMSYFTSSIFVVSLLLQNGLGLTPLQAGLAFAPMAVAGVVAPLVGKRWIIVHGTTKVILLGCAIDLFANLALALTLHLQGGHVDVLWLAAALALTGLGNTLILPALIGATLSGVQPRQAGIASGMLNTTQQFAGAAGLAVVGTVFFHALGTPPAGAAGHAAAGETAAWISVALVAAMAVLTAALARPSRANSPSAHREPVTTTGR